MNYPIAMAEIQSIGNSLDNLTDLWLILDSMKVPIITKFSSLHVLHDDVKIILTIVDFVYLNNIWMIELTISNKLYLEKYLAFVEVDLQVIRFDLFPMLNLLFTYRLF